MKQSDSTIGRYTLISKIADGGFAEVFRATAGGALGFEKWVALKKILPSLASQEKYRQHFINEARICSQLHHHNVIEVYDFGIDGDDLYLVMELIDGLDLEAVLEFHRRLEQGIDSDVIVSVFTQLLTGLDYAHEARDFDGQALGVIHRNLKPSNILIDMDGIVKIVDFSLARATTRSYETQEMTAKGTASYMAPEQLMGDKPLSRAADLFAAGAILYEMLTLMRLFDGEHVFAILKQVATMDIDAHVDAWVTGADRRFLPILRKALARSPEDRYARASDMLRDLASLHVFGSTPRRLADHLRHIRNADLAYEDARTRLVTTQDGPFSDEDEDEDSLEDQVTQVEEARDEMGKSMTAPLTTLLDTATETTANPSEMAPTSAARSQVLPDPDQAGSHVPETAQSTVTPRSGPGGPPVPSPPSGGPTPVAGTAGEAAPASLAPDDGASRPSVPTDVSSPGSPSALSIGPIANEPAGMSVPLLLGAAIGIVILLIIYGIYGS